MATLEQIAEAIRRADAAGNAEDVMALGQAYRALQAQGNGVAGEANANASAASQRLQGRVADLPSRQPERPNLLNSTLATVNGLSASVPFLQNMTDAIGGSVAQVTGGDYGQYVDRQRAIREGLAQSAPLARTAGEVAGYVAAPLAAGSTRIGAEALGLTGSFGQRLTNSALSGAGFSTADALSRGETGGSALASGALGGGVGAAMPVIGAGLRAGGRAINDKLIQPVATMLNPDNAVTANLGRAVAAARNTGDMLTAADEAIAGKAGIPVLNADRLGAPGRRLARTASNIDSEAASRFSRVIEDRFKGQGIRSENFVKTIMGGATDDLALKDALRTAADKSNGLAYGKAFSDPKARAIWNQPIADLMQSNSFLQAVKAAEDMGTDMAAISGVKAVRNPFDFLPDGGVTLKVNKDGSRALPSLQFWNQVKRALDRQIDAVKPTVVGGGNRTEWSNLNQIRQKLVGALDSAVPSYKDARSGAAAFFGADDAIDAGRKAVTMSKQVPELERAVKAFKPAEKDAAAVGYASEMIDMIKAAGDNRNLMITNLFNSPSARARNALFLGEGRARELEAYVRVETLVDALRGAVKGNSSTAEQLIAAGAVGTGVGLATGDWQSGLTVGALAGIGMKALKAGGKRVDETVMRKVAEALLSSDPKMLDRAIKTASASQKQMDVIEALMRGVATVSRGAGMAGAASMMQPAN